MPLVSWLSLPSIIYFVWENTLSLGLLSSMVAASGPPGRFNSQSGVLVSSKTTANSRENPHWTSYSLQTTQSYASPTKRMVAWEMSLHTRATRIIPLAPRSALPTASTTSYPMEEAATPSFVTTSPTMAYGIPSPRTNLDSASALQSSNSTSPPQAVSTHGTLASTRYALEVQWP